MNTALPNMPTREEVEGAIASFNHECVVGHHTEVLLNAARAYLMLDAAHKGNVNTIEHFTNLLNEEKSKRLAAEFQVGRLREALNDAVRILELDFDYRPDDDAANGWSEIRAILNSTPPTDVLERVRKMAAALESFRPITEEFSWIKITRKWLCESCSVIDEGELNDLQHKPDCKWSLRKEALEQAKEMGLV